MAKRRVETSLLNVWAAAFGGAFLGAQAGNAGARVSSAYNRYLKKIGDLAMDDSDRAALQAAEAKRERKNEKRLYNWRRCLENAPGYLTEHLTVCWYEPPPPCHWR